MVVSVVRVFMSAASAELRASASRIVSVRTAAVPGWFSVCRVPLSQAAPLVDAVAHAAARTARHAAPCRRRAVAVKNSVKDRGSFQPRSQFWQNQLKISMRLN
jgi:hypothetical protein